MSWDQHLKGTNGDDVIIGGSGDDFIQGRAGNDTIDGAGGNDQIHGDSSDDHLRGGAGNDFISGGEGFDRAYYTGSILEYSFSTNGEHQYVNHTGGSGVDGNDDLILVEQLVFADAVITLGQNNAPIAFDDSASTNEDVGTYSSGSTSVLDNDFDFEGDNLSVTAGTFTGSYGTLTLNSNGTYTYTPFASTQALAQGQVVQDSFSYTVSDGSLTDTGTLTINISGVNDAPTANPDMASTGENSIVTVDVLANDDDVDNGAVLTVISASAPMGQGSASVVGNQVQFDPGTDFDHLDTGESANVVVSYTIEDEHGATSSSTVTITVNGANDAPVANDDTALTDEDNPVSGNVLANDTDVDIETLTVTNPGTYVGAYGTLILAADGSYTYTPNAAAQALDDGESVNDMFSYTASDGTASDTATLTVTVDGVNDAPVANDDTASTTEDANASGNVLANDTDVDVETLTVANPGTYVGAYGTLILAADGSYTYTPGAAAQGLDVGESAQDVFSYTATDGTASDGATLTVTVTGLNDAPVANDDTATTDENSPVSGNVLANDTDVDVETLTVTNPGTYIGAYGTLVLAANGSYTYTPGAAAALLNTGQSVNDIFNYIASDGTATDGATLTITVNGLSGAPDAVDDTATTNEDASVSGNVLTNDTDPENDTLTVSNPGTYVGTYGTLTLAANGSYTYTPNAAADGLAAGETAQDVFSYTATDGTASDTANLTVTINGTNDAPTIDAGGTDASGSVTELPDGDPNEDITVHTDSGTVAFDDLDLSDTHSASFTPQGGGYLGTFTLDPVDQMGDNVGWDFSVSDAALEGLSEGEVRIQTYTVEIDDGNGGTVTQDVTITITGAGVGVGPQTVWYIDNSAVGSANLGTQADPYTSIASFNAAQGTLGGPQTGHTVHLLAGTGTGIYAEADGINLLNGQILVGDATGPVRPTIVTTAGDGINVAQNNNVSGIDIGTTSGAGIADSGGTVGNLTVTDVGKSGGGQIADLDQGGTLNVTLNSAVSTGSTGGAIDLNAVGGSFTVSGVTTITGIHSGNGVDVTASSATVTFAGGGLISTGAARAVNFVGNSGTLAITGGNFDLTTTTGRALNVETGGTVTITGAGNNITSTTAHAVLISNATSGGVTLESVSSTGGTLSGIVLNNAGSGGFTVTGLGSTAGSGGTIANKSGTDALVATQGNGIYIDNTSNVSLANMTLSGTFTNFGIRGNNVNNFTLSDSSISGTLGTSNALNESAVSLTNLTGTALIEGNTIAGGFTDNLRVTTSSGGLTLNIQDSASDQAVMGLNNNLNGNDSIYVESSGSAVLTLTIDGVDVLGARGDMLQVNALGTSTQDVVISGTTFNNTHTGTVSGGGGVLLNGGGAGANINVDYLVENSTFQGAVGTALAVSYLTPAGTIQGRIEGNVVGLDDNIQGNQGASSGGSGISVGSQKMAGAGTLTHAVAIVDNEVYDIAQGLAGIQLAANGGAAAGSNVLEADVDGNIIDDMGDLSFTAFYAVVGGSASSGDFAQLGLDLTDNVIDASDGDFTGNAIVLDQISVDARYYFPGYAGSANGELATPAGTASADLEAFFASNGNTLSSGPFALNGFDVDASFLVGASGDPLVLPPWMP